MLPAGANADRLSRHDVALDEAVPQCGERLGDLVFASLGNENRSSSIDFYLGFDDRLITLGDHGRLAAPALRVQRA